MRLELRPITAPRLHFTVPADGRHLKVLHDWQVNGIQIRGTQKSPTPETVPPSKPQMIALTPDVAEFAFQAVMIAHPGMSRDEGIKHWLELNVLRLCMVIDRSWTNGFWDPISGRNVGADPMEWKTLGFGGNVHTKLYGTTIKAIDPASIQRVGTRSDGSPKLDPDPAELYDRDWMLFQWPTQISKPMLDDRTYPIDTFRMFGAPGIIIPFFYPGGECSVPGERLESINNSAAWKPWNP